MASDRSRRPAPSSQLPAHVKYDINEMPPVGEALLLALQHVMVMMASNVTIPIILATAIGATTGETVFLVQVALFAAGLTTLIQTIGIGPVGARLPVVQGTSFGFLVVSIPLAQEYGLAAVLGGALFAGSVKFVLGFSLKWLRGLFPPLVSGIVVLVIGIGLLPTGMHLYGGGNGAEDFGSWENLGLATLVLVVLLLAYRFGKGIIASASVLVSLVVGYLVAIALGKVDFSPVSEASWFAFPTPLEFGLEFPAAAFIAMGAMAIAVSIETIGDLSAITKAGAGREVTDRELAGGVMGDGAATSVAAVFSALPNTTFGQNVGLVALTGVMSRHVVTICAGFLIALGLVPKLAAVITAMPSAVLGGAAVVMFGMLLGAGIQLLAECRLDRHDLIVIAASIGVGQGFAAVPAAAEVMPESLRVLMTSGILPAALIAVLLNLLRPRPEEGAAFVDVDTPLPDTVQRPEQQ
ncbi:uracil-xanthine permease family protein [Nocardioides sp. Arc9.136]|uniref:uracil-xanthine permease family protein n=1 Tax=Nocardioides sp. Arc9.136 TaxID=2996826 RepID=UPI00266618D5|nr:nucleobase:cation symporter-2 family protein [Nocardioides sp. Arc9.136]WKN47950.1 nucleobase:cation symporter-2 family protein [Nocardioides sp. Arc9.136]